MYYLKKSFSFYIFLAFSAVAVGSAIAFAGEHRVLSLVLNALNLVVYSVFTAMEGYRIGQKAYKTMLANDLNRAEIVRTGDNLPINVQAEYKPFKGLILASVVNALIIIVGIIYFIFVLCGTNDSIFNVVLRFIGMPTYGIIALAFQSNNPAIALLMVPLNYILIGVSYYFGAKKLELQQEKIKTIQKERQGAKNGVNK